MEKITWQTKHFKDLTTEEYFEILFLRTQIFVVEQNCPYQEVDEKDRFSYHLFGKTKKGKLIAVARILPKGVSYKNISFGRIAVKKEYRGKGIADEMMKNLFNYVEQQFGKQKIRISAQQYLLSFYNKHGFSPIGEMYLEDNIPHVEMIALMN